MPPSMDDLEVMAGEIIETLPEELAEFSDSMAVQIEDMADEALEALERCQQVYRN